MSKEQKFLDHLLRVEEILKERVQNPLTEPEALIEWAGIKLLSPGSLLSIQGKSGSHKSRLAEEFAITLLSPIRDKPNALGMKRIHENSILVVGIDTERDTKFQFPIAIKKVIDKSDNPEIEKLFRFTSLIHLKRHDRRNAAREFLQSIRNHYDGMLCLYIDVVSDISTDFNSVGDMGEVIDLIKEWLNEFNCSIIVVLHENPGSDKMRGHLGTEILNKATDSISIKLDKNDGIKIEFKKCRNYRRPDDVDVIYNENSGRLELDSSEYREDSNIQARFINLLTDLYKVKTVYSKTELVKIGKERLNRSKDSIEDYIKEVTTLSIDGVDFVLDREMDKKEAFYKLQPINHKAAALN